MTFSDSEEEEGGAVAMPGQGAAPHVLEPCSVGHGKSSAPPPTSEACAPESRMGDATLGSAVADASEPCREEPPLPPVNPSTSAGARLEQELTMLVMALWACEAH